MRAVGAATASLGSRIRTAAAENAPGFQSSWHGTRLWAGKEYWASPLQDWRVEDGEVIGKAGAGRTLHLLTHQVGATGGGFEMEVTVRLASSGAGDSTLAETWAGFVFGVRGELPGYQPPLVHPADSLAAGLRSDGRVFCGASIGGTVPLDSPVRLILSVRADGSALESTLAARPASGGTPTEVAEMVEASRLPGNVGLAAHAPGRAGPETTGVEWGFRDWRVGGPQVEAHPDQTFGPILWTQYTLSRGTLKLAALFPPLGEDDEWTARLETRRRARWSTVAAAPIERLSRTAVFRIENWDDTRDIDYRVAYSWQDEKHYWGGRIRKDPRSRERLRIGVFSCDHGEVFPQHRMVRNVMVQDPDIVFFAGDQIYEAYGGFGVARGKPSEEAMIDYLRKYWQFGWTWRSILKERPSIIIPDDHDVFQGNIWGQGGRALPPSRMAGDSREADI